MVKTLEQLKNELEAVKKNSDCTPESWEKLHEIENEIAKRFGYYAVSNGRQPDDWK